MQPKQNGWLHSYSGGIGKRTIGSSAQSARTCKGCCAGAARESSSPMGWVKTLHVACSGARVLRRSSPKQVGYKTYTTGFVGYVA